MPPWNRLSLTTPPALETLGDTLSQSVDTVKTALETLKALSTAALATAQDPSGPTVAGFNAALQALVSALTDAVDGLLDDDGIYVLPVPLPKKGFVQALANANADETGTNYLRFPASVLVGGLSDAERTRLQRTPLWQQILDSENTFLGGNAYFVQTLAESMSDADDPNRPRFERSDSWAYVLIVTGAPDVTSLGAPLAYLDRTFAHGSSTGTSRGTVTIVPQNPRASLSGRSLHAVIEWDPVTVSRLLESYDNSTLVATDYVIIRSTDFRAKTAISVSDLFATTNLQAGTRGRYGAQVVHAARFDGIATRWEDTTALREDTTYFYHVAFKGELRNPSTSRNARVTPVPYGPLSRCLEVRRDARRAGAPTRGAPPDWIRTPSVATLLPQVEGFLDTVKEQINNYARATQNFTDRNTEYLTFLQTQIDRLTRLADDVLTYTNGITDALTVPSGGPQVATKFATGTGTAAEFLAQVVQAFSDETDENRPTFDTGDEFVIGMVLLAVGPDPSRIAGAAALFRALFGGGEEDPVVEGVRSVTQVAVDTVSAIDDEIRAVQREIDDAQNPAQGFDSAMVPTTTGDAGCAPAVLPVPAAFSPALTPTEET